MAGRVGNCQLTGTIYNNDWEWVDFAKSIFLFGLDPGNINEPHIIIGGGFLLFFMNQYKFIKTWI